jgi:hypothetical protein
MLPHRPQILTKVGTTARAPFPGLEIACDPAEASRTTTPHRLHAMAAGLVGQTIEQATGHPRMRALCAAKAPPASCG